ncbi:MAG TPA: hypothetical protein VMP01_18645 [Pirellulaceae bacterium]|nr:hypothetical protein [Pirellulaceae bacterium]
MKTFWYATLVTLTSLVLGTLVSQSFGADRSGGRSISGSGRSVGQVRSGGLNSGVSRKVSGSQGLGGFKPTTRVPTPVVNPRPPISRSPVVGPIKPLPPIVKPPVGPIKPPVVGPIRPPIGPIKPPIVGPIKPPVGPIGPIKPPIVGPIGPIGPIKPPVGPIGPIKPPVVGPIKPPIVGPIGPIGPIKPLPPICPPYCPPKCPPICPPWNPGGYCGPWYPLPGWVDCYRPCPPICVTIPTYVGTPVVTETVVVETVAPAVAVTEVASEEKLMQIPVGATLQLNEKTLGEKQGQVVLQIDTLSVPAQVNEWKAEQVNVTLPMFGLAAPTKAHIWMMRADGQVANKLAVELIPAKAPAEAAATATTAAVTQN